MVNLQDYQLRIYNSRNSKDLIVLGQVVTEYEVIYNSRNSKDLIVPRLGCLLARASTTVEIQKT